MRIKFRQAAGEGTRFASDAFAGQEGRTVPVRDENGAPLGEGTVVRVDVVEDGRAAELTLDIDAPEGEPLNALENYIVPGASVGVSLRR